MLLLANVLHFALPLIALILCSIGLFRNRIYHITSSLWLAFIALAIQYQHANREFLGNYFNYTNTLLFAISLTVFTIAAMYLLAQINRAHSLTKYGITLIQACMVLTSGLVLTNSVINAYFISNKLQGTPIIQAALMKKPSYCNYQYIFYKISASGATHYLCPNYYGLIPKIGVLAIAPDFITMHLSLPNRQQLLELQQRKH